MIRRRSIFALTALFGVVILVLAYQGIRSSRENMLKLLRQEGESLMQALITSAKNNLATSVIVEEAASERLVDVGKLLGELIDRNINFTDSLDVWQRRYRLERIDIYDNLHKIKQSSWDESEGDSATDPDEESVIDTVLSGVKDLAAAPPMPSALPIDDNSYLAVKTKLGVLVLTAKAKKLTDYQESLGIGFVVRQMGEQDEVLYAVLQSSQGIVLASKSIEQLSSIDADTFLANALTHEQIVNRFYNFQGEQVLEMVRSFKSDVLPSGIFRLGMSLDVYNQLYSDSLKQLGILSLVLFALGILGSYAAISTRRLEVTEENLVRLKSVTDEIIHSLEAAVISTDKENRIIIFNPAAESIFGMSARAVMNQPYLQAYKSDILSLSRSGSDRGKVFRGEIAYQRDDGTRLQLLVSTASVISAKGEFTGAVSLVYDMTDIRRLEENARASERLSELGTLAAGVAHEIRNPLNSIGIAAQRLRIEFEPRENPSDYELFLKTITDEIERLNKIVKDFLSLARGSKLNKVLVDLKDFLDDIVVLAQLETAKQNILIKVDAPGGVSVALDKLEMRQVILNLIKNASEAMKSGGEITISGRKEGTGKVTIDVTNTGSSIPADIRPRIFQPYFTTRPDGTGLGLSICQRIVGDHGGRMELLPGDPTTFRIVI